MENSSQSIGKLIEALSKAQGVMEEAKKDSKNPYFKSAYADLGSMWNACRKPLAENGLAIVQTVEQMEGKPCLVTLLGHTSGEWIKSVLPLPLAKMDPQAIGSAITYCRRYALGAIVGISATEDDDGEKAMKVARKTTLNINQIDSITEIVGDNETLLKRVLDHNQVDAIEEIPQENYERIMTYLEKATSKIHRMA